MDEKDWGGTVLAVAPFFYRRWSKHLGQDRSQVAISQFQRTYCVFRAQSKVDEMVWPSMRGPVEVDRQITGDLLIR
jgi:hypothetical protein